MRKLTGILFLLLLCLPTSYSQTEQKSDAINIYFDHNSHAINLDLKQNRESLLRFSDLIEKINSDTLSTISKIVVNSSASPEGGRIFNAKLTEKRSNAIYDYLTNTISVPDSLIDKKHSGTNWDKLQVLVEESDMPYRDEVLYILKNVPEETWRRVNPTDRWLSLVDSRNKHLMELEYGKPYYYMFDNIYPELRNGSVVTIYFEQKLPPVVEPKVVVDEVESVEPEVVAKQEPAVEPVVEQAPVAEPAQEPTIKPLLALKTNLLFDAATLINVELEVPIGKRWSVAGEWIFPWWTWDDGTAQSARNRIQLLQGNLMGKYWFGDREIRPVMTGWFAGLYAGAGLYDFEHHKDGIQGEFFIAGGLAAGYAHTINKSGNLRMEYSLGVGYLQTDYRRYTADYYGEDDWRAIRTSTGNYKWLGPTQAKVSLVWLLNYKTMKGGKR